MLGTVASRISFFIIKSKTIQILQGGDLVEQTKQKEISKDQRFIFGCHGLCRRSINWM